MRVNRSKWLMALFLLVLFAGTSFVPSVGEASEGTGKTYIEFIFDSSFSMNETVEGEKTRMDVAKEVLKEIIGKLEDRPDLEIGLRVYGSRNTLCNDTVLVQPFGAVNAVRNSILKTVLALQPRGKTPIGFSLEEAAKDFPEGKGGRNVIVLITDGLESCGADPCAISNSLQAQGVILRPYVVGFGLPKEDEAKVQCIGNYFSASNGASLLTALQTILVEVVSSPVLEVEAWAGGRNVTDATRFDIQSPGGSVIRDKTSSGSLLTLTLAEGVYAVRGRLPVGRDTLTTEQTGISLNPGQTTRVRLDFGSLEGTVRVRAKASGQDVSDAIDIQVTQKGQPVGTNWKGVPPTAKLNAGEYQVTVKLRADSGLRAQQTATISPGRVTELEFDLGDLQGQIGVAARAAGKPISPGLLSVRVVGGGKSSAEFAELSGQLVGRLPVGVYDVYCTYVSSPRQERVARKVEVKAGATQSVLMEFDEPGRIGVIVTNAGVPVKGANVSLYRGDTIVEPFKQAEDKVGTFEVGALEGTYSVLIQSGIPGYEERWIKDIKVLPGQKVERTVELTTGKMRLTITLGGNPVPNSSRFMLWMDDSYVCDLVRQSASVFEADVRAGTYELHIAELGDGYAERTVGGLVVPAGGILEKSLDAGGEGRVELRITLNGKPVKKARVMVWDLENTYICDLKLNEQGAFVGSMKEGTYQTELGELGEGITDRKGPQLQIRPGETQQLAVDLGGKAKVVVKVLTNGKPLPPGLGRVMVWEEGTDRYMRDLDLVKPGVFEGELEDGRYYLELLELGDSIPNRKGGTFEIAGGTPVERTVNIGGIAQVTVRLSLNGKPFNQPEGRLFVYRESDGEYIDELERTKPGVFQGELEEERYLVEVTELDDIIPTMPSFKLEVSGDKVAQTLDLGKSGRLQIELSDVPNPDETELILYTENGAYVCSLEPVGSRRFAAEVISGVYAVEVSLGADYEPFWVRGLEIPGGGTLKRSIEVDASAFQDESEDEAYEEEGYDDESEEADYEDEEYEESEE